MSYGLVYRESGGGIFSIKLQVYVKFTNQPAQFINQKLGGQGGGGGNLALPPESHGRSFDE